MSSAHVLALRLFLLTTAAAAACVAARSLAASGYHYFGLRVGGRAAVVSLDSATVAESAHVAVWVGVNSPTLDAWVQGGIAQEGDASTPEAYIEIHEGARRFFHAWPVRFGQKIRVRLRHPRGRSWRVIVAGHWSRLVTVHRATVASVLETYGDATGTATINQRTVTAR